MIGTQATETKVRRRQIIISGPESLAVLRRFLNSKEPELMKSTMNLWRSQAAQVSNADAAHMVSTRTLPENLQRVWERQNADFVHEVVVPGWIDGLAGAGVDIERRIKRVQKKALLTNNAIASWVTNHAGELIVELNTSQRGMITALLRMGILQYDLSPYTLSRIIKPCIGLTDRWALAVGNRYSALIGGGMDADAAMDMAEKYAAYLLDLRSMNIARTELANAYNDGQLLALQETGETIRKTWATAGDELTCGPCADMDGEEQDINANYSAGISCPPLHVCCRCSEEFAIVWE